VANATELLQDGACGGLTQGEAVAADLSAGLELCGGGDGEKGVVDEDAEGRGEQIGCGGEVLRAGEHFDSGCGDEQFAASGFTVSGLRSVSAEDDGC